ncbi:MAG: hypothetical protein Q9196_001234 [Gyalolechia fulgens]
MGPPILQAPSTSNSSNLPSLTQLVGKWYITHTTSDFWRDKRNVVLTYTPLDASNAGPASRPLLDDLITYQTLTSAKVKTMRGTDTPSPSDPRAWTWRGNGMLKFVTSHCQILGYGEAEDEEHGGGDWLVIWAQRSIFSPAVLNLCTRHKEGMREEWVAGVKEVCGGMGDEQLEKTVGSIYRVTHE